MEPAAAIKTLQCQKPAYMVQPEGVGNSFGQMAMPDGTMSKTGFRAEIPGSYPPNDRVEVAYVGLPGKEVVAGVARQVDFPPGQQSKYDDLRSGLISKYGQPTDTQDNQYSTRLFWLRGPDGKGLSQASDRHTFCMNESNSGGSFSSTPDCGLVIVALINRSNDNPSAVQHFEIGTVDEAKVYSIADQASTYVKNLRGSGGTTPKL